MAKDLISPPEIFIDKQKLTKDDVNTLNAVLDIYTRLMMGQFSDVANHIKIALSGKIDSIKLNAMVEKMESIQQLLHSDGKNWSLFDPKVSITASKASRLEYLIAGNKTVAKSLQEHIEEQSVSKMLTDLEKIQSSLN